MTYRIPTLILVGAAQTVVLENTGSFDEKCVETDNAKPGWSDVPELW